MEKKELTQEIITLALDYSKGVIDADSLTEEILYVVIKYLNSQS